MSQALPQSRGPAGTAPADAPNWNLDPRLSDDKDQAKRAFLRLMSHELRTPLNSIIGFSEVLCQQLYGPLGSPDYLEYAGIIRDSGTKLLNLFNNFIDIVRLEGGSDYRLAPEAILPCFEQAVAKAKTLASARAVHFDIRLHDEDFSAVFDPRGLMACLDQLISNAIDFTAPGDAIQLDAMPAGDYVEISVYNRGPAPDPEDIERLMRPFEQGSSEHNRSRQGAGLGWAIVRLNCQVMGGEFQVMARKDESLIAILRLKRA